MNNKQTIFQHWINLRVKCLFEGGKFNKYIRVELREISNTDGWKEASEGDEYFGSFKLEFLNLQESTLFEFERVKITVGCYPYFL